MTPKVPAGQPKETCSECEKIELEKKLAAEESARAFDRELAKMARQGELDLEKLRAAHTNALAAAEEEHKNALDSAEETATTELQKARWQNEFDLGKLFHEKISEVAGGSIERARDSAKFIQTVAAGLGTLYGALLALAFSATSTPLPLRGVYSALFLGLAVALASGYLAFITKPEAIKSIYGGGASLTEQQLNRTGYLVSWINSAVFDRRWALRASVVCLAFGVAFIPAPFVTPSHSVKVPDAPVAPTIPGAIAAEVGPAAVKLFREEAASYKTALEEHNKASEEAAKAAIDVPGEEADLNTVTLGLAVVALLLALLGPLVYGHYRDKP